MLITLITLRGVLLTGEACKETNTEFRQVFHRQKSTFVHSRYFCCLNSYVKKCSEHVVHCWSVTEV